MRVIMFGAAVATLLLGAPARGAENPWATLARQDLQAIRTLLRDNHPGAVDPERRHFAEWLDAGFAAADREAAAATSYPDYARAVRRYVNGFRDSHTGLSLLVSNPAEWTGFVVRRADDGKVRVSGVDAAEGVQVGDEIVACDGEPVEQLLERTIYPYFVNPDIPHLQEQAVYRLFLKGAKDPLQARSCTFQGATGTRSLPLAWRALGAGYTKAIATAFVRPVNDMGIRQVGGVWFLSVPTFMADTQEQIAKLDKLIADVRAKSSALRSGSPLVIDVRGNGGGHSGFATRLAEALWGEPLVKWVSAPFDWTHDWRASPANLKRIRDKVEWAKANNQATDYPQKAELVVKAALATAQPYGRHPSPGEARSAQAPASPVKGKVFFLTDGGCGSSCLDFADIVLRVPGVTQIGSPTHADAAYIDIGEPELLPSGIATLNWSLKVYRNRVRDHNEFYTPKVATPRGMLSYEDIAGFVKART